MLKENSYRAAVRMATLSLSLSAKMILLFLLRIILNPNTYSYIRNAGIISGF